MSKKDCLSNELIQNFLDKQLPADKMATVTEHLKKCDSCQNELNQLQQVFMAADRFAEKQLKAPVANSAIDEVMHKISRKALGREKDAGSAVRNYDGIFWGLKWILAPCFAVLLTVLLINSKSGELRHQALSDEKFSLLKNTAELILGNHDESMVLSGKKIRFADISCIPLEQMAELPPDTLLLMRVGAHRFNFNNGAVFTCTTNEVVLKEGNMSVDLSGAHVGLDIKTSAVTVIPMGTAFELEVKSWGTKVCLKSGKIEMINSKGLHRIVEKPETIYVSLDGRYLKEVPQPEKRPDSLSTGGRPDSPTGSGAKSDEASSPNKLLDSF